MILLDYNNIAVSNILANMSNGIIVEENLLRHLIINTILSYKKKFSDYGKPVICCDGPNSWRRDFFPYYKVSRKREDPNSLIDWNELFRILNLVREEAKEFLPYPVVHVDRAEGDDAIAVIAKNIPGPHMIVSNDKDFGQLQKIEGVLQYLSLKEKILKIDDPNMFLKEHIIRGDSGDDVPNILSDDDVRVVPGKRQKSIMSKKMPDYLSARLEANFSEANIKRNTTMIDFDMIPDWISKPILDQFQNQSNKKVTKEDVRNYFFSKKLKKLMEDIQTI